MAQDPYKYFRIEARELIDQLGKTILELERGPSPELVARVLRVAHTLKGAARVVRQREIADLAHSIEDALVPLRASSEPVPRGGIDALLRLVDDMSGRLTSLGAAPQAEATPARRSPPEDTVRALHA